ncbi:hypothetical protein FJQ54_05185 [Sandaracinobacter neustonicus]|uniref:Uncharacterized protein n=1 Tax=Sandaracinobacter neustonicus TaxID=1715348 RepID=A0A501XQ52_9SPHN|nr:O-methyltransferase [Sandaracinobacter neustonicus]TPE62585.1 hypothetical protein FJQ54_05185 [Sandaracinobacter neustonicus]
MIGKSMVGARSIDVFDLAIFVDLLNRVQRVCSVTNHAYGAMSGFALDDQRRLYRALGLKRLLAFSTDVSLAQRQMFNKPISDARRVHADFDDIVSNWHDLFENEGIEDTDKFILWLRRDAANNPASGPRQFQELANSIGLDGILRITLEIDFDVWAGPLYRDNARLTVAEREEVARARVESELSDFLAPSDYSNPMDLHALCIAVAKAYGNAAAAGVAGATDRIFEPMSVVRCGADPVEITITGMVIRPKRKKALRNAITDGAWPFASATWDDLKILLVPDLTVRERIELEKIGNNRALAVTSLGFDLDEIIGQVGVFDSFIQFHRYLPTMIAAEM